MQYTPLCTTCLWQGILIRLFQILEEGPRSRSEQILCHQLCYTSIYEIIPQSRKIIRGVTPPQPPVFGFLPSPLSSPLWKIYWQVELSSDKLNSWVETELGKYLNLNWIEGWTSLKLFVFLYPWCYLQRLLQESLISLEVSVDLK